VLPLGREIAEEPMKQHFGGAALLGSLILVTIWWNWPDWGRWGYWFPSNPQIVTLATCQRSQLTTMSPHDGGSRSPVALNEGVALAIFRNPGARANLEKELDDIHRRVEQFMAVVADGHVVRVPEDKLVRYLRPSTFANWIVEVEVFREGAPTLSGFAYWGDLTCFPYRH
jgi:hypothetical protein